MVGGLNGVMTLAAIGDVCPGDHYFTLGHGLGARFRAGARPLAPIAPLLQECDLAVANLEGVLAEVSAREAGVEGRVFRGPAAAAGALLENGIRVAHVANNHVLQHGTAAFEAMCQTLDAYGIAALGRFGEAPRQFELQAMKVAMLGFSLVPERYVPQQELYACGGVDAMTAQVRALAAQVDAVVVSVHWGDEGVSLPSPEVIATARALAEAGARVVLGHHPHVFQPVVRMGGALVAFSLGDGLFDLFWDRQLIESAVLRVRIPPQRDGRIDYELIPVALGRDYFVRPLPPLRARAFFARLAAAEAALQLAPQDYARLYRMQLCAAERRMQRSKVPFFVSNAWRGDVPAKARFVWRKFARALSAAS